MADLNDGLSRLKNRLVLLRWRDTTSSDDWEEVSEAVSRESCIVVSCGWLVGITEKDITIVSCLVDDTVRITPETQASMIVTIPLVCVVSVQKLQATEDAKPVKGAS